MDNVENPANQKVAAKVPPELIRPTSSFKRVPLFPLMRYFSLVSFASIAVIALLLGYFYRYYSVQWMIQHVEQTNVILAKALSNSLSSDVQTLGLLVKNVAEGQAPRVMHTEIIDSLVTNLVQALPVLRVQVIDPSGVTVYSTVRQQIGEQLESNSIGRKTIDEGMVKTEISERPEFVAIGKIVYDRIVITSYVPTSTPRRDETDSVGIFRLDYDATAHFNDIYSIQRQVCFGVFFLLSILYGCLLIVVRHADRIIKRQAADRDLMVGEIEASNRTLEKHVEQRTQALRQAVAELNRSKSGLEELVDERTKALAEARDQALRANAMKSVFLATMSHELRTPLTAIIGYSDMIVEDATDPQGAVMVVADAQKIAAAGKHLLNVINDVLDLSKIEAGKCDIHWHETNILTVVTSVISSLAPLARKNRNRIVVEPFMEQATLHTDDTRFKQILFNLVSNANKFTANGMITLRVTWEKSAGRDFVVITVMDTGIGMSEDQLSRIFDAFVQADQSTTRKYGGTGLGLTISRRLCELLGGSISVESKLNVGSVFSLRLPTHPRSDDAPKLSPARAETSDYDVRLQ